MSKQKVNEENTPQRPGIKIRMSCDELCLEKRNWGVHDCCTFQNECDISFRAYIEWTKEERVAALLDELKKLGVDVPQEKRSTDAIDICNLIRKKLKEVSKGQPETFGFVALFLDIVNKAQGQVIGIAEEQQLPDEVPLPKPPKEGGDVERKD